MTSNNRKRRPTSIILAAAICLVPALAVGDIYQWAWKVPGDTSQGKIQSATVCPGGAGASAGPSAYLASLNLNQAYLINANLTGADLEYATLSNADLSRATLTGANFTGATVTGANFDSTTSKGFTAQQLYSTASYQAGDLSDIILWSNNLTGWDFAGKNLSGANLADATLTSANFTGAIITGAILDYARGFTAQQLYSTASYQTGDLTGLHMETNDLTGWNFAGKNLTAADLWLTTLSNANLTGTNLTDASLLAATLNNANLTGANLTRASFWDATLIGATFASANVQGANFGATTDKGFTSAQLYATASYQAKDLSRLDLSWNDLTGWSFAQQNLANARFDSSTLDAANFASADLRGAVGFDPSTVVTTNMIWPDGRIEGLHLSGAAAPLVIRNNSEGIAIRVGQAASLSSGAVLHMLIDRDWNATISFDPGIAVTRGGNLRLGLAANVDPTPLAGTNFRLFDWSGVTPTGQFQVTSDLPPGFSWNTTNLYSTGFVTLAGALVRTWNGGSTAGIDWSNCANWDTPFTLATTDTLVFAGATAGAPHNDLVNQQVAAVRFTAGAGAFQLGGNVLKVAGPIDDQATTKQQIDLPIEFVAGPNSGAVNVALGGELTFAGRISGNQGLTKTGAGTLELVQDAAYTGDTAVQAGTLVVQGLSNGDSTTVSGTLVADYIRQDMLTINAGGTVQIDATGGVSNTSIVNFLNIADAAGGYSWGAGGNSPATQGLTVVPEPAAWGLILVALCAIAARRTFSRRR